MEDVQYVLSTEPTCATGLLPCEQQAFDIGPKRMCDSKATTCFRAVPFRKELMSWLGGWELPSLPFPVEIPYLPDIIVSIRGDERCPFTDDVYGPAIAARLDEVVGIGDRNPPNLGTWRRRRGIPEDVTLVLHQESPDDLLMDVLFRVIADSSRLSAIRDLGRIVVVAPAPSIYTRGANQCRKQQATHLSLAVHAYCRVVAAGIPAVLNLGWATSKDLDRLAAMLRQAGDRVNTIAVNMQSRGRTQDQTLSEIASLELAVGRSYRWIMIGALSNHFLVKAEAAVPQERRIHVSAQLREKSIQSLTLANRQTGLTADQTLQLNLGHARSAMDKAKVGNRVRITKAG